MLRTLSYLMYVQVRLPRCYSVNCRCGSMPCTIVRGCQQAMSRPALSRGGELTPRRVALTRSPHRGAHVSLRSSLQIHISCLKLPRPYICSICAAMAQKKTGGTAASPLRPGCDVSDLEFDSATDPKEGGNGDLLRASPLKSICLNHSSHFVQVSSCGHSTTAPRPPSNAPESKSLSTRATSRSSRWK
jgi:hypothetical protein